MTATAHRHGLHVHAHPHDGAHRHVWHPRRSRPINDAHHRDQGHSHGLLDDSIKRSRAGLHAVGISLAVLGATAAIQAAIYVATGSVALLADLIHNFGDALTAVPLGAAFLLGSARAERWAGLAVVLAIFVSACVAGVVAIEKIITPHAPEHLLALGIAGAVGFAGNEVAAQAPSWYRPWARWPPMVSSPLEGIAFDLDIEIRPPDALQTSHTRQPSASS